LLAEHITLYVLGVISSYTEHITCYVLGKGFVTAQISPSTYLRGQNALGR